MRVLMFGWEFPPYQAGGLATATVGLVKGLLRQGVTVTLVVPFPVTQSPLEGLKLVGLDDPTQLTVHRLPSPMLPYGGEAGYQEVLAATPSTSQAPRAVYGATLIEEVDRFAAVAGEIAAREPHDVIDAHDWLTFHAAMQARAISGKPFVAHIHATEYDRAGEHGHAEILRREAEGLHAADRIVSNSHVLKRACVERFGVPAERIDVVHWGVDGEVEPVDPATPAPGLALVRAPVRQKRKPVVLFLGRITWQKGPEYFIELAGRVSRHVPEARFVVAGTGDLLPRLIRRAAELGIAHRVHFAGGLGGADVARAYRMADVCVMPSVSEPFGLVALESLRHGTPCIVPRTAGVSEAITNAIKVDFWDVEEMTNQVVALLRYPELQQELRENGLTEVRHPRFGLEEPARLTAQSYGRARALAQGAH
jgi:glycosyltransferase involved in cell wall biosynthesis